MNGEGRNDFPIGIMSSDTHTLEGEYIKRESERGSARNNDFDVTK